MGSEIYTATRFMLGGVTSTIPGVTAIGGVARASLNDDLRSMTGPQGFDSEESFLLALSATLATEPAWIKKNIYRVRVEAHKQPADYLIELRNQLIVRRGTLLARLDVARVLDVKTEDLEKIVEAAQLQTDQCWDSMQSSISNGDDVIHANEFAKGCIGLEKYLRKHIARLELNPVVDNEAPDLLTLYVSSFLATMQSTPAIIKR